MLDDSVLKHHKLWENVDLNEERNVPLWSQNVRPKVAVIVAD